VAQAKTSSANTLKQLLPRLLQHSDDLRIVIDGIDEISASVHRPLIKELLYLTRCHESTCRLLIVSQDLPSISCQLLKTPRLSLNEERKSVEKDLSMIIHARLQDIDDWHQGALGDTTILSLKNDILAKAEGRKLFQNCVSVINITIQGCSSGFI